MYVDTWQTMRTKGNVCHMLSRTDKLFTLDINGKKETVSIDRVKRAFLNTNTQEPHIPPTYTHEHIPTPVEKNTMPKDNYVTTTAVQKIYQ